MRTPSHCHIHPSLSLFLRSYQLAHWDVLNEPLHGSFYDGRLGASILPWMFNRTAALDPSAQLFVNDFNTIEECDSLAHPETYLQVGGARSGTDVAVAYGAAVYGVVPDTRGGG